MYCVKLPGLRIMPRDFDRRVAGFQIRVAVMNGFTVLGIPVTTGAGQVRAREADVRSSADLCKNAIVNAPTLNPAGVVILVTVNPFKASAAGKQCSPADMRCVDVSIHPFQRACSRKS